MPWQTTGAPSNGDGALRTPTARSTTTTTTAAAVQRPTEALGETPPAAFNAPPGPIPDTVSQTAATDRASEPLTPLPGRIATSRSETTPKHVLTKGITVPDASHVAPEPALQAPSSDVKPPNQENRAAALALAAAATARPAALGQPAASAETRPRPAPDRTTQAPGRSALAPKPLQAQLPGQATPARPRAQVVAPAPAAHSPETGRVSPPALAQSAQPVEAAPPAATATPAVIQRSVAAWDHAHSAEAASPIGSNDSSAEQPAGLTRTPASSAPRLAATPGQRAPGTSDQTSRQSTPLARPALTDAERPTPLSSPPAQQERAAATGLQTSRSRPADEPAVVRPVLPTASDLPAGPGSAPRATPQREPAPLPTIRVTIGRIEVRSSAPALPAAPGLPGRPRPALSLDDYLKRPAKVRP